MKELVLMTLKRFPIKIFLGLAIILSSFLVAPRPAYAQEAPICPLFCSIGCIAGTSTCITPPDPEADPIIIDPITPGPIIIDPNPPPLAPNPGGPAPSSNPVISSGGNDEACGNGQKPWDFLPGVCTYHRVKESFAELDIRRTVQDMILTLAVEVPVQAIYARSIDQLHVCVVKTMSEVGVCSAPSGLAPLIAEADCTDLQWNPLLAAAGVSVPPPTTGRALGSFAGITTSLMNATYVAPPPVNLALYGSHVASKVPVLGNTAFAQQTLLDSDAFNVVLEIWELSRNIAYGILAVFMLVIGVMIMMRKQLDPKTSVTIQNALPRIVISVILITFSYAIGAFAITLIPALVVASLQPLVQVGEEIVKLGPMILIASTVWRVMGTTGAGGISVLLFVIAGIVLFALLLWVLIRAYLSFIKIILSIITGPLTFAWGAIPGNEKATTDWFKQVAVNVLVVPAMMFLIGVAFLIAYKLQITGFCEAVNVEASEFGVGGFYDAFRDSKGSSVMVNLQVPLIMMSIFFFAAKLPKKLEEMILGDKKK